MGCAAVRASVEYVSAFTISLDAAIKPRDASGMPNIMADQRWMGDHGIGRFAREVISRLGPTREVPTERSPLHPLDPWLLRRALKRTKPDLYFSPGFNAPRPCDVPCVLTIHDLIHIDVAEESSRRKRWYYDKVVAPVVKRAPAVLTVSRFSKKRIADYFAIDAGKVHVVGNGVSSAFSPEGETAHHVDKQHHQHAGYLLYVGNHKPHKNVQTLLTAFSMAEVDPAIGLVMTGKPDEAMFKAIAQAGLTDRIRFIEGLSDEQLARWYRGAVALVCPSSYEGFGMPVLEAMACGTPVVCSDAASLPEVAGEGSDAAALLVRPGDHEGLANAIGKIVADEPLRQNLSAKGIARAKQFNWDSVAQSILSVLAI